MEKLSQIYDREETQKFVVLLLNDDEDLSVHMEELDEINFCSIIQHVNTGGSVFITRRKKPHTVPKFSQQTDDALRKPFFFRDI